MKRMWTKYGRKLTVSTLSALMLAGYMPVNVFAEGNADSVSSTEVEETAELKQFDSVIDFIENFSELTDDEIITHINVFQLYSDDEAELHSTIEVVEIEIDSLDSNQHVNQMSELIDYLDDVRRENETKLKENPDLINQDLIEENVDVNESLNAFHANASTQSIMTSSSANTLNRLHGEDRYETAISISKHGWSRADTVVIVNANGFADALAGAPLAKALNAPVLLAGRSSGNSKTLREIDRLGARRVIILGGEAAVSKSFEDAVKNRNINVERIAGSNRYDTANRIADRVIGLTKSSQAILVSGEDFADAMSVAPFAARNGTPIYLTRSNSLSSQVRDATESIKNWTVIGGFAAVDGTVGRQLSNRSHSFRRIDGANRYETNRNVISHYGVQSTEVFVATGREHMDALSGSVIAAKKGTGVMLVNNNNSVINASTAFMTEQALNQVTLFGGLAALSQRVEDAIKNRPSNVKKPLVFIDVGHGGADAGATFQGYREKDIVLTTSLMLRDLILKSGDYELVMSRETDKYLTLSERSSMANRVNADISISIHVNSMGGQWAGLAQGIETFIYHPTYQTSRLAFDVNNYRIRESLRLADAVHNSLMANTTLANRGVRGANLHMVREPNMPAILPELGFINNLHDLSIVKTHAFQKTAAESIMQGIDIYFGN